MKSRNFIALTLSVVMIMSSFLAFYSVPPNETQFTPAAGTSTTTFNVNVTINPNGSVTNSSAVTIAGNTYTLNGNLSGNLTILCSDCVVNGAGFSVNGTYGDCGLYIGHASNVLVSNITVVNSSNGVEIYNSTYITIINLTADSSNGYGIFAIQTGELTLRASNISAISESIALEYANDTYLYNNSLTGASNVLDFENSNGFYSSNDSFQASNCAFFSLESSSAYLNHDNLSGAKYGAEIEYSNNIFITYSNLSDESTDGAYIEYSGVVNLSHDILNETLTSANAVDLQYGYTPLFMYYDFINTTGDAVDLDESSYGAVISDSYVYVGDVFYADYSTQCTKITNDFIHATGAEPVHLGGSANSNVLVKNCTLIDGTNGAYGIYIESSSASNVTVVNDTFENVYDPVYFVPYIGADYFVADNSFINSYDAITFWYTANTTIQGNTFINCSDEAVYGVEVSNAYIYDNKMLNTTNYAIDVEYSTGDLVISGNVISNSTATTDGIYVNYIVGGEIFDNLLANLSRGVYVEYSFDVSCYNNHFFNDNYSIYDDYNSGVNYYGNSIVNSTDRAFYSYSSSNSSIYGNTFQNARIYLLDLENTVNTQIYHNNFVNGEGVRSYIYFVGNYLTSWNSTLPVGGNYWSDNPQNGQGTSGIGTDPYVFDSYDVDYYPLTAQWVPYSVQFTETGLPSGQLWNVTLGNSLISSDTGTITFTPSAAQHAQVPYTVGSIPGYTAISSTGTVTLNTGNQTIAVAFAQTTYGVKFTESGLPSGTTWYVNITGGQSYSSTTSTITADLTNGSYSYTVASSNKTYAPSTYTGSFTVDGSNISEPVQFNVFEPYWVTFVDSGLPYRSTWGFPYITNYYATDIYTNGLGMTLTSFHNGTYNYLVTTSNKLYQPVYPTGSFTVNGQNLTVTIEFVPVTYSTTFTESGLPSGTTWYINSTSFNSGPISGSSYTVSLTNGSYTYSIASSNKIYAPSVYTGSFTINGQAVSESIQFNEVTYSTTFTETGLPSGTTWYVNVTNSTGTTTSYSSAGSSLNFQETNGTYTYSIATASKIYAPGTYSGSFAVNGQAVSESVSFSEILYRVVFSENGLPSGSTWYVNLSSGSTVVASLSGTGLLSVSLPNGTYSYSIASANKTYAPASYTGSFNVDGASPSIAETQFSLITNSVSFTETGLPAGTSWSIVLGGYLESATSTQISFSVPNGTYSCVVLSVPGYSASYQSSITVVSATQNVSIQFIKTNYTVTISETGLASGTTWTFTLGGKEYSSNTATATVTLTEGSYALNVSAPTGYNVSAPSSVSADNNNVTVSVAFVPIPSTTSGSSVSLDLGLGIGAIVGVIAGVIGYMFYTRVGSSSGIRGKRKD